MKNNKYHFTLKNNTQYQTKMHINKPECLCVLACFLEGIAGIPFVVVSG